MVLRLVEILVDTDQLGSKSTNLGGEALANVRTAVDPSANSDFTRRGDFVRVHVGSPTSIRT